MKSYKEFILEKSMDIQTAMSIFGIEELPTKKEITVKYRELSQLYHPDKGGTTRQMQKLNAAYSILKAFAGETKEDPIASYEAMAEKYRSLAKKIKEQFEKEFDPQEYIKYFEKLSGKKFDYTMELQPTDDVYNPVHSTLKANFFMKDSDETSFDLFISVMLSDVIRSSGSLGSGDITVSMTVLGIGFHNNREQKMGQRAWKFSNQKKLFKDPTLVFPEKKVKDIFGGKKNKFTKKDAILFLEKRLDAKLKISGSQYDFTIPVSDNLTIKGNRMTVKREGIIMLNTVNDDNSRAFELIETHSFSESEDNFKILYDVVKSNKREKKKEKLAKAIYSVIKDL